MESFKIDQPADEQPGTAERDRLIAAAELMDRAGIDWRRHVSVRLAADIIEAVRASDG